MDTKGAQLVGSVKQVRFAEKIRAAWVKSQIDLIEQAKRIGAGDFSDLVMGPHEQGTQEHFAAMPARIEASLARILRETSAKYWIEGPEGQWFRVNNPLPRRGGRSYGRGSYRATRSNGMCEDAPCCGCCGPNGDDSNQWGGM